MIYEYSHAAANNILPCETYLILWIISVVTYNSFSIDNTTQFHNYMRSRIGQQNETTIRVSI